MPNIGKSVPGGNANLHVPFDGRRGEIHGLLGENGAGKSTLMKILYGLYSLDDGEIYLDGERIEIDSPQQAIDAGIGMVHQHFMLIPKLTVTENVVLGRREPGAYFRDEASEGAEDPDEGRRSLVDKLGALFTIGLDSPKERIEELAGEYGFRIDPDQRVWELEVGEQQRVEILKALYRDVDLLILDEPTAVLTPTEAERLFETISRLAEDGLSIIFITHKLKEIMAVTDRVTVLRDGARVDSVETADVTRADLAEMMVGHEVLFQVDKADVDPGDTILEATDVEARDDRGLRALKGVDVNIRSGEILGIAGVSGNGQKELAECLVGVRDLEDGTIRVDGTDLTGKHPRAFIDAGVSFIPEDRMKYGLATSVSVMHNATIKEYRYERFGDRLLDYGELEAYADELVEAFDVRGIRNVRSVTAGDLSGGNMQKLIVGREIYRNPDVLIANQPTRGVDVGAIESIREYLLDQREEGMGILLVSEDLDEILDLSDRIRVIYEGEFVHETTPEAAEREHVGLMMTGGTGGDGTREAISADGTAGPDRTTGGDDG
ncbi:MAG: ABC transporter ATP-binding protein [Halobacteriales archaeon]